MNPNPAKEIFVAATKLAPEQWDAFLHEACGGDAALRDRVRNLLAAHREGGSFLEPASADAVVTMDEPISERPGTVIGPYKLLQQIGEGGMGTVFMAEQTQPVQRKVALKIIKPGMDSRQVIARFEAERQALALMDHPNIAKVLEAGETASGRPYFVMELVKGQPITKYCDERHLTPRQRLDLFVPVCQAVQHAHQKGIIHRDLKPSNVMVCLYDGKPVPKVIDFGVAKAAGPRLTEHTLFTEFGQVVGTFEYMSPEQAELNQLDIDTRSDIYSLGVLLYELLTGTTPLERKRFKEVAFLEVLRLIREEESPKPSTRLSTTEGLPSIAANRSSEPRKLGGLMRGELDWIAMKALDKDRNRRYETANGFAADVQRYLNDEAVQACPPSVMYKLRKFVRRNKRALTMTSVVALAMLFVVGILGWIVRDRAAKEQESIQDRAGRQARLVGQVELILGEVDRLEQEQKWPEALAAARRAQDLLASGEAGAEIVGNVQAAVRDLETVRTLEEIRASLSETKQESFDHRRAAERYAAAFRECGIDVEGRSIEDAVQQLQSRPAIGAALVAALDDWAGVCRKGALGNRPGAETLWQLANRVDADPWRSKMRLAYVDRDGKLLLALAAAPDLARQGPATLEELGHSLVDLGELEAGIAVLTLAQREYPADFWVHFSLADALYRKTPPNLDQVIGCYRSALAVRPRSVPAYNNLGNVLYNQKKLEEAIACFKKAIELNPNYAPAVSNLGTVLHDQKKLEEAIACYHKALEIDPNYAKVHNNLGLAMVDQKQLKDAIASFRKAIEIEPKQADLHNNLGVALRDQKKQDDAIASFRKAIEIDANYAKAHNNLGIALYDQKKLEEAIASYRKALELDPKQAGFHNNLGLALYKQKKPDEAIASYRKAIELDPKQADYHNNLGNSLQNEKKLDEAIASFWKALELDPNYAKAHSNLGNALEAQGKVDEAIAAFRQAIALDPKLVPAHQGLGNALASQNDLLGAIAAYKQAIALDPKLATLHYNLGIALADQHDLPGAIAAYKQAIALDPKWAAPHNNLGNALAAQNDLPGAIAELREAIRLQPDDAATHDNLGIQLAAQNDLPGAVAAFKQAIKFDPKNASAHNNLSAALLIQNDLPGAIAALRTAIDLEPSMADAHRNLGMALSRKGAFVEAAAALREAIRLDPRHAAACWDLALLLANCPDLELRRPPEALAMSKKAVELAPRSANAWQSVGLAQYRVGDWKASIEALEKSIELNKEGADSLQWFFLAMAQHKLGHEKEARQWYDRAAEWMEKNQPMNEELRRLRAEAAALLKVKVNEP